MAKKATTPAVFPSRVGPEASSLAKQASPSARSWLPPGERSAIDGALRGVAGERRATVGTLGRIIDEEGDVDGSESAIADGDGIVAGIPDGARVAKRTRDIEGVARRWCNALRRVYRYRD